MTTRLMTLLCFSLQSGDVTERASFRASVHKALLERNGKLLTGSEAEIEVFIFESPTEAVLGATEVLHLINSHEQTEIRIVVHTVELDTSSSVLEGTAMSIAREMLERTAWGDLCVSESSYLSMQRSEVGNKVEETSWNLKVGNRKVVMYRINIKSDAGLIENDRRQQRADLRALRRGAKNAPYDRRVLAFLVDYFVALLVLGCVSVLKILPEVWNVCTSRIIAEFEDFDVENARRDLSWKAYGGEFASLGYKARLSKKIIFVTSRSPKATY